MARARKQLAGYFEDTAAEFRDRFNSAVADLDARVAQLAQTESDLWDVQPTVQASGDVALQSSWQAAMDKVIAMNSSIDSIRSQIQNVASWWAGVASSFGITPGSGGALAGLALFPAIPWTTVALIVGGTTAIAGVIYAASLVINRARQYQFSQADTASQAAGNGPLVNPYEQQDSEAGILDSISAALPWLIGGAVVLMISRNSRG